MMTEPTLCTAKMNKLDLLQCDTTQTIRTSRDAGVILAMRVYRILRLLCHRRARPGDLDQVARQCHYNRDDRDISVHARLRGLCPAMGDMGERQVAAGTRQGRRSESTAT